MDRRAESPQNSGIRALTRKPREQIAWFIHNTTPIKADQISYVGIVLGAIGAFAAYRLDTPEGGKMTKKRRVMAGLVVAAPMLLDALDGPVSVLEKEVRVDMSADPNRARYSGAEIDESVSGGLLDFRVDRAQELMYSVSRVVIAHKRGSVVGQVAADLAGRTNPEPSLGRAEAEKAGHYVKEIATGADILGNRVGRGVAAVVAAAFPEAQPVIDLAVAFSNKLSFLDRMDIARSELPVSRRIPGQNAKKEFEFKVTERLARCKIDEAKAIRVVGGAVLTMTQVLLGRKAG